MGSDTTTEETSEADMSKTSGILILTTAAALIAACTNMDGTSNRTATGGLLGAGAGAVLGRAIDGGGTTGTLVGGALGSMAGAAIGASLDKQQKELQAGLGDSGATVTNTGSQLVVTLPESITFDVDSAVVHPDYVDEIAFVARSLRDNPASNVQVIGHTDNTGSAAHNQALSERRADAVAKILTDNGVASMRVTAIGRGFDQPVASNDTPGGRAQNRRVEIVITPTAPA
jgi:outer membrane protein OmpA-like peptidoglycan-associated protein